MYASTYVYDVCNVYMYVSMYVCTSYEQGFGSMHPCVCTPDVRILYTVYVL